MSVGVNLPGSIPSLSECNPGLRPMEFNVLILPEATEEKTKGGIILIEGTREAEKAAATKGRLVAISPAAFDFAEFPKDQLPRPGDLVWFGKFAGTTVKGNDGRDYRICKDRDIGAVIEEAA